MKGAINLQATLKDINFKNFNQHRLYFVVLILAINQLNAQILVCCIIQLDLLVVSTTVFETCRGI